MILLSIYVTRDTKTSHENVVLYTVLLAIATNIPLCFMIGFVVQGHIVFSFIQECKVI